MGGGGTKVSPERSPGCSREEAAAGPLAFLGGWGSVKAVREVVKAAKGSDACFLGLVELNSRLRTPGLDYKLLNTGNQDNDHW